MAARPGLVEAEPEIAAEQFLALLRAGVYFRATLGLEPEPDEPAIDAVVTAAVRAFLRAYGVQGSDRTPVGDGITGCDRIQDKSAR